ncbi:hypothetical protein MMC17_003317 [Xylographa soralifera]|nr:hypothetical protein [Xylographa soralifera]
MLAVPALAVHMAHMAAQLAPQRVTIYTHGDPALAAAIIAASGPHPGWMTDARAIARLELLDGSGDEAEGEDGSGDGKEGGIVIVFADGSRVTEGFLAHSPLTAVRGPWAEQLGCGRTRAGDWEVRGMFGETGVAGVYAAGDCMTPLKVAANAVASGATAGAGVAVRLQEERWGLEPLF